MSTIHKQQEKFKLQQNTDNKTAEMLSQIIINN